MHTIVFRKDAAKALQNMPQNTARLIRDKIDVVAVDPYAQNANVKALKDRPGYRLRVGDWRILYDLDDDLCVLTVERIRPRGVAYQ